MHVKIVLFLFLLITNYSLQADRKWNSFKTEVASQASSLPGSCSKKQALLMMDLIHKNKCQQCIEIGVFAGSSVFPIAQALKYNGTGLVHAIDAWDSLEAKNGLLLSDAKYQQWAELDLNRVHQNFVTFIRKNSLQKFCRILKSKSQDAVHLFADETIDFIHFDGSRNEEVVFQDVVSYFPKVKNGGYILLKQPCNYTTRRALVFLLERVETLSPFEGNSEFFLFRKNAERIKKAKKLMKDNGD